MIKENLEKLEFLIPGVPKPKQSARFFGFKTAEGKVKIKSYQKTEVKDTEANIGYIVHSSLPENHIPWDCAIGVEVKFVFPIPSNFTKKKMLELEAGKIFYKTTKPDLTDNLMKGLMDALSGIVFKDDARIAKVFGTEKIFGEVPRTEIIFYKLLE